VPLVRRSLSPFESLSEYPVTGNKLNVNSTHVFWPSKQKLFSKFYMRLEYENQTIFGFSQQHFGPQRAITLFPQAGHTMGANDHLAFVKAEGSWRNHYSTVSQDGLDFESGTIEFTPDQAAVLRQRIMTQYQWAAVSGIPLLTGQQGILSNQLPLLKNQSYNADSVDLEARLKDDMDSFSSGISHTQYHNFEKSALACIHLNINNIELTTEEGKEGWWLPLKTNFLGWRAIGLQEPMSKYMVTFGTVSFTFDPEEDFVNVVFKSGQLFRGDLDDLNLSNTRLDVAPPNDIDDDRPLPPLKPSGVIANQLQHFLKTSANNYLPWAPREQLCPQDEFESRFKMFSDSCPNTLQPDMTCIRHFMNFYPCFNYYLRSSRKFSHGMDGLMEFIVINHLASEAPWDAIKTMAEGKPWDDEFEAAIDVLRLDPTAGQ